MNEPSATETVADDYERHAVWLRKLAGGLVNDPAAADDLVQETWLAALRSGVAKGAAVRPWLKAVLVNTARRAYRTNDRRTTREVLSHDVPEPLASAAELAESADLAQALMDEVRSLPEPLRVALLLRYMEGLPAAEIARRSNQPVGTVRWRLAEARKELRTRMDRRLGTREAWAGLAAPLGLPLAPLRVQGKGLVHAKAGAKASLLVGRGAGLAMAFACLATVAGIWWMLGSGAMRGAAGEEVVLAPLTTLGTSELVGPDPRVASERTVVATTANLKTKAPTSPKRSASRSRTPSVEGDQVGVSLAAFDEEGRALKGALLQWDGSNAAVASVDETGVATLLFRPPVSGALLKFRIEAKGFADQVIERTLRAGTVTWLGEITLIRAITRRGQVVNEEGLPVEGAKVFLAPVGGAGALSEDSPSSHHTRSAPAGLSDASVDPVLTDRDGEFVFPRAPAKVHCVWAVSDGTWYTGSDPIAPQNLEPITVVLKNLPEAATIRGRVVDADSQPLSDVLVRLTPESLPASTKAEAVELETEADGTFTFRVRDSGSYRIEAEDLLDRWDNLTMGGLRSGARNVEIRLKTPL